MAVFYNSKSGLYVTASQSLNPIAEAQFLGQEALLHAGAGWHEYSTIADMNAAVAKNGWPNPESGTNPANIPGGAVTGAANTAAQAASIPGIKQIGDFFGRLANANTWLRAGEVLLGLILVAIGVARITHAVPIATSVARTVT